MISPAAGGLDSADVFSADLWAGSGTNQTVETELLEMTDYLLWIKNRSTTQVHTLLSSAYSGKYLSSSSTAAPVTDATTLQSMQNDNGYTVGTSAKTNQNDQPIIGWSFKPAPKFFDIVTWTGDGNQDRGIPHNLGCIGGLVIVKSTSSVDNWYTYSSGLPGSEYLLFNSSAAKASPISAPVPIYANSTTLWVHYNAGSYPYWKHNTLGVDYVAFIFAHDPDGIIQSGSYTGNGSAAGPAIDLGWEPQFLMIKRIDSTGDWLMFDSARGMMPYEYYINGDPFLTGNVSSAETNSVDYVDSTSTGFSIKSATTAINASGGSYVYMAIREPIKKRPWDVRRLTLNDTFGYAATGLTSRANAMAFKPDGTKMYLVGESEGVWEYNLSTAWDLSSASFFQTLSFPEGTHRNFGISFKPDGTKMFLTSITPLGIYEYNLSTAWDISTATYARVEASLMATYTPVGMSAFFKPDGTKLYVVNQGAGGDKVVQYTVYTPHSVASIGYAGALTLSGHSPSDMHISDDGLTLWILNGNPRVIDYYKLGTAWEVSTAIPMARYDGITGMSEPAGFAFKPDGTKMYATSAGVQTLHEYLIG